MSPVLHQVLLADLNNLAEIWDIHSDNIGLEINADGELVPKLIDEGDGASLSEMIDVAVREFPDSDELDFVVLVHESAAGNKMVISTLEYVCSPQVTAVKSRWWTFTDDYKNQMN